MKQPFKYFVICNKTKKTLYETNQAPLKHNLVTLEPTDIKNVLEYKQTRTAYIDTRYEAKLRLFNYVMFTKKGLEIPKYRPFGYNKEIGKSIPILGHYDNRRI